MHPILDGFKHYIGVLVLLLALYFGAANLIDKFHHETLTGPTVSATLQTKPSNAVTAAIGVAAEAMKNREVAAALAGQALNLSAAEQTVANTIAQATGLRGQMANAAAVGFMKPSPKRQVVTVGTNTTATLTAAPITQDDTAIQRDLKKVLNDPGTVIHTHNDTSVKISWEDAPRSPVFAFYGTGKTTGAGYTLKQTPLLDLDAILAINEGHTAFGVGVDHIFKGTSASIGAAEVFNPTTRKASTVVFIGVH